MFLDVFLKDLRYAWASLSRQPGFTTIAVLVLALGIGANAAMFSLVDGVLLKPLPFPHAERLVRIWEEPRPGTPNATSAQDFVDWQRMGTLFESMAAERSLSLSLIGHGDPVRLSGKAVTARYFDVYATGAARGRVFNDATDAESDGSVVVLSHAAWQTYFGGDPAILDRQLVLDGRAYQVVGILPRGAFDRDRAEFWVPLIFTPQQLVRDAHWLTVHGRLRDGVTLAQAREQMHAIDAALADVTPAYKRDWTITVERLDQLLVSKDLRQSITIAFGAAGLVLLIACANVANLLLARGATRAKELAVRAALGAGRGRLIAQLLTESLLLSVVGGAVGIGLAFFLVQAIAPLLADTIPYTADVRLDTRVLIFSSAIAIGVALVVGVLPSLQTRVAHLSATLQQSGRGASAARAGIRRTIVVAEVALSLVLIAGAALLLRTLLNLQRLDTGVRTDNIVTIAADLPINVYPTPESAAAFYESIAERVANVPGVERAGFTTNLPLRWIGYGEGFSLPGRSPVSVRFKRVDPGYFTTFGIPMRSGRGLTTQDRAGAARVAVINKALARWLSDTAAITDPLGTVFSISTPGYGGRQGSRLNVRIVGVIRSERVGVPWRPDPPVVYLSLAQLPAQSITLAVRTSGDATAAIPAIRDALRQSAPNLPVGVIATMDTVVGNTLSVATRPAWVIGVFAAVAAMLAGLGLYGVLAHVVAQQRREIGIRVALGARAADVVTLIAKNALSMMLVGLALGLAGAFALTRLLTTLLYGVSPLDPLALVAACVAMMVVGLMATLVPARRAAMVDPSSVLHE